MFYGRTPSFFNIIGLLHIYRLFCHLRGKKGEAAAMQWPALMGRFSELDQKWSERFNRLEALLLSKSLQPTFSSEVRVTPSHSPPVNVSRDTELFFQPTHRNLEDSSPKRTGPDISAAQQPSAGKLTSDSSTSSSACKAHWSRQYCCKAEVDRQA